MTQHELDAKLNECMQVRPPGPLARAPWVAQEYEGVVCLWNARTDDMWIRKRRGRKWKAVPGLQEKLGA